jgi:hypothetical protein
MTPTETETDDERRRRRNGNGFRYSDRFIRIWTIVLIAVLVVFPVVGVILLASSDSPDPQPVGLTLVITGIAGPILVGAILGGNAILKGGGWIGVVFTLGFAGVVAGPVMASLLSPFGVPITVAGGILLALGGVGFWVIGFKAKVPMWIQAPTFGSPRLYVTKQRPTGEHSPRHVADDDQARDEPQPR